MIRILNELKECGSIAVSGHVRPDGDCVGSCLALALFLRKAMPNAQVDVFLENIPEELQRNAAGADTVNRDYRTDIESYDAFVCLDCEKERLGDALPIFARAKKTLNVDHHKSNPGSARINYIVPGASSTCELVYNMITASAEGDALLDEEIARNLYIGMVTDTGIFQYSNTSRRTMEIAGRLLDFGFDFSRIVREVFNEKTYVQQLVLGRALMESVRFHDDRCIYSVLDRKTMQIYNAGSADVDGIASQLVRTHGVCCAVFLHEMTPLTFKASFRSTGEVDVSKLAQCFGGGGHERAAGCTFTGMRWQEIMEQVKVKIAEQLDAENGI